MTNRLGEVQRSVEVKDILVREKSSKNEIREMREEHLREQEWLMEDIRAEEEMILWTLPPWNKSPLEREWSLLWKEREAFDREVKSFRRASTLGSMAHSQYLRPTMTGTGMMSNSTGSHSAAKAKNISFENATSR